MGTALAIFVGGGIAGAIAAAFVGDAQAPDTGLTQRAGAVFCTGLAVLAKLALACAIAALGGSFARFVLGVARLIGFTAAILGATLTIFLLIGFTSPVATGQ